MHRVVTEPQPIHGARAKILDKDVHRLDEPQAKLDSLGAFEIDRDAELAAVEPHEEARLIAVVGRAPTAADIAAVARLELVDVGPILRENQRAKGTSQRMREIEHAKPRQRLARIEIRGIAFNWG